MKPTSIFTLIFFFFLYACAGKTDAPRKIYLAEHISDFRPAKLSLIADSLRYIPLESPDTALLAEIFSEGIKYRNGEFYITDHLGQRCLVFDTEGKYLRSIGKAGRAAGEYIRIPSPLHFIIHPASGNFEVLTFNKYVIYDKQGNFLREYPVPEKFSAPGYRPGQILGLPDGGYFAPLYNTKTDDWNYTFLNPDGSPADNDRFRQTESEPYREPVKSGGEIRFGVLRVPQAYLIGNSVRLITPDNDTLYTVSPGGKMTADYILDKGKYKRQTDNFANGSYINIYGLKETRDHLFFTCLFRNIPVPESLDKKNPHAWYNKKTGKLAFLSKGENSGYGFINDLDNGTDFWPLCFTPDGKWMISITDASEFIEAAAGSASLRMKETARGLTEDSNPVITLARLK